MQTRKQKDFAAGLRTWERPRAGLSKCGASVFYEPCDEARAHFWGQVAEVKGKTKVGPGASAAAAAVALLPLTACRQLPIQRAQRALGLNSMNKTRQDKTCLNADEGARQVAGAGGAAVVCVRSLGLSSLMNLSVSCPRQTIIIIKSTKWWLLYHHQHHQQRNTLLFSYFQICLKIFLWVALPRGTLHLAPGVHTPMYVFFIIYVYGHYEFRAEQTHYHKKEEENYTYLSVA